MWCAVILWDHFLFFRHGKKSRTPRKRPSILWKCASVIKKHALISKTWRHRGPKRTAWGLKSSLVTVKINVLRLSSIRMTKLTATLLRLTGWSRSACSTKKWLKCRKSPTSSRLRLWSTWSAARRKSRRSCALRSRPWNVSNSDSTWFAALTKKTRREFKFKRKSLALKRRRLTGLENCRTQVKYRHRPSANSRLRLMEM